MNTLLTKLQLSTTFESELDIEKSVFIHEMETLINTTSSPLPFIIFPAWQPNSKKYVGTLTTNSFKMREHISIRNSLTTNIASVSAAFEEQGTSLTVRTTIRGMQVVPFIIRAFVVCVYLLVMSLVFIESLLMPVSHSTDNSMIILPLILTLFVGFLTYLPYRIAQANTLKKKEEMLHLYKRMVKNNSASL